MTSSTSPAIGPGLASPTAVYPPAPEQRPTAELSSGAYRLRFARDAADLDAIERLRFEVFNLELREGLQESFATGRDHDPFDLHCHHLLVEHAPSRAVVGTYRLQTAEMAHAGAGFYTDTEFDLAALPSRIAADAIELGRACIAREHRKKPVLFLLWRGLAAYLGHNRRRYFFGCCSLTSQDDALGWRVYDHLVAGGLMWRDGEVPGRARFACAGGPGQPAPSGAAPVVLPPLFDMYLRYGGKVCGPPIIDREFGTIDFLVLFDTLAMDPRSYRVFFDADMRT